MYLPGIFHRVFLLVILLFLVFIPSAQAQNFQDSSDSTERSRIFTILNGLMSYTTCQLSGIDLVYRDQNCSSAGVTLEEGQKVGGALGFITNTMALSFTAPASSITYGHYLADNFGISHTSYAQGQQFEGFNALTPVLKLWEMMRNIAYLLAVIFFVLVGFGIMIRYKIDPRTVMTIQNQLPKIVITLILVSFSYAIAGLFIDVMWISTYVGINSISDAVGDNALAGKATANLLTNPINYFSEIYSVSEGSWDGIGSLALQIGGYTANNAADIFLDVIGFNDSNYDCGTGFLGDGNPSDCAKSVVDFLLRLFLTPIISIIVLLAILAALIKVWFLLLRSWIYIMIYIIFSPLWILLGVMPGSSLGFTSWMRSMFARLMLFPAAAGLFMLARAFSHQNVKVEGSSAAFNPPLIGNPSIVSNGLGDLMAFAVVLIAPELLNILMEAFKTKPFAHSKAISSGIAKGAHIPAALAGGIAGRMWKTDQQGKPAGILDTALYGKLNDMRNRGGKRGFIGRTGGGIYKAFRGRPSDTSMEAHGKTSRGTPSQQPLSNNPPGGTPPTTQQQLPQPTRPTPPTNPNPRAPDDGGEIGMS